MLAAGKLIAVMLAGSDFDSTSRSPSNRRFRPKGDVPPRGASVPVAAGHPINKREGDGCHDEGEMNDDQQ
jgi:hypothetical protein